jgi:flagellar biosynthesis protein FlhA
LSGIMNSPIFSLLKKNKDMLVALAIVGIVFIIVVPVPAVLLDVLFTMSITFSLIIMLITMFTTETLQFSVFPSLLLVSTLFRLSLNVSSTRLILRDASAGEIINAFGNFVIGGNYVVGFVIFVIITVIQFVVITNGAGRVAEVAARFTLDAMPGKQMSIDADFNAGLLDEAEARKKRLDLQREADFYGAMDGASKFVKGDAIAGVIIVLTNILGGLAIGVIQEGMPIDQAVHIYTLLTVGDGLVSQIPAILISTAAGILVTRSGNDSNLGQNFTAQLLSFPKVIMMAAGITLMFGFVPGLPFFPFFILAAGSGLSAYMLMQEEKNRITAPAQGIQVEREKTFDADDFLKAVNVDVMEIELGYNLLRLTDHEDGGDLLDRITAARRQIALELGLMIQPIRVRDNLQLPPNRYAIKLKNNALATGELLVGHFLAMDPGGVTDEVEGIPTKEPTFGLDALWIEPKDKDEAELVGYTVVDPAAVLVTHLTSIIKNHSYELLGRQEVKMLVDNIQRDHPAVIEELIPQQLSIGDVQKVLQNLLRERMPIRDIITILESLADNAPDNKDIDYLTEAVRQSLARTLCHMYACKNDKLFVMTLDPELEQKIAASLHHTAQGTYPMLDPGITQRVINNLATQAENMSMQGYAPIALVTPRIRLPLRRLIERSLPNMTLLSYNEILPGMDVEAVGVVNAS